MSDLPTFDELKEMHNIPDDTATLEAGGETDDGEWKAICDPTLSQDDEPHLGPNGAPFEIEAVGAYPPVTELGTRFAEMFDERVNRVYQEVEGADDALEAIMEVSFDDGLTQLIEEVSSGDGLTEQ